MVLIIKSKKYGHHEVIYDDADHELISSYKWRLRKGRYTFYAQAHVNSEEKMTTIQMHILIMGIGNIDHRNGNGLDNTRVNLRHSTSSQNNANAKKRADNTSGFKGVHKDKRYANSSYMAYITKDGKRVHLGSFDTKINAAIAYNNAALKLHGEFARLNIIE